MEQVQADLPYKAFPAADGVVERSYCTQSGLLASGSCPSTAVGYYLSLIHILLSCRVL